MYQSYHYNESTAAAQSYTTVIMLGRKMSHTSKIKEAIYIKYAAVNIIKALLSNVYST